MVPTSYTGVEVKVTFFPLAFIYWLCPVYVVINGVSMRAKWGAQFYPLAPGRYTVGCFTKYLIAQRCGWNTVDVDIYPGQVVRVTWTAPHVTFMKGPIRAELIASTPPPPAPMPVAPLMPTAAPASRLCQRCYATLPPGADACPACGARTA